MVAVFEVIDTIEQNFEASGNMPARKNKLLVLLDRGECPMRQMPRYVLDPAQGEVEKYAAGQLNRQTIKIEIREMAGRGNPTMRGRIVGPVNGSAK